MTSCEYVLLPYNSSYNYRVSSVFFEAIVFGKRCIINGHNTLKYYAEKFPKTVILYEGCEDFFDTVNNIHSCDNRDELSLIRKVYSHDAIVEQFETVLNYGGI